MIERHPRSTPFPYTTLFRSMQVHGRFFAVLPKLTSHWSHATPSISAAWRCTSNTECVHRQAAEIDRKSTRLNSSHRCISYAVFCLKKKSKTVLIIQDK